MSSRILSISDNQSILELFRLLLEAEGYDVLLSKMACEDASDIERLHPDLIIVDFKLGAHHVGWTLLQKLTSYPPTKPIPLIVCATALQDVREQEETLRQQGIPVIYKPFDVNALLLVMRHLLSPSPRTFLN